MVKNILCILFILMISTFVYAEPVSSSPSSRQTVDQIAVIINDEVITKSELDNSVEQAKIQLAHNHIEAPTDEQLRQQVLQQLIRVKLQIQIATRVGIQVTSSEINEAIQRMASEQKLTLDQLKEALQKEGVSFALYQEKIKTELLLMKLQQEAVGRDITITEQDVNAAYKRYQMQQMATTEYHIADIVIPLPETPTTQQLAETETHANAVAKELQSGEDFQKIAAKESSGSTALSGGDLGWQKLGELPELYVPILMNMKVGSVTQPIRTPNGFHILQLKGVKNASYEPITQSEVRMMLYRKAMNEKLDTWLQKMQGSAYIKIVTP